MPLEKEIEKLVRTLALKNALDHDGKAQLDAVLSKFLGSRPDKRAEIKSLIPDIKSAVQAVNAMAPADQKALLEEIAPGELEAKKQVESGPRLPALEGAVMGRVVTRFPPEPNGYPHIGHAKAAIIDEEYARMYGGKLILRFDDTNPLKEKLEYYDAIAAGLQWLGVKPDIVKNTSDDMAKIQELGKKLVQNGGAYVCTCSQEKIRDLRSKGLPCECRRDRSTALDRIGNMFSGSYGPNDAIIRFKGDMADQNTAMRDPALFRIIEGEHPKLGSRERVWPTYDFAAPVEDSLDGVTHAMRTKEYELRNALYFAILDRLGMRKPAMIEFSRLEFEGVPVSKRKIRPLIDDGTIQSWDDPRLPTLSAFRRRGFVPEAIRKFVLSLGITLAETKPPFESLEAFNRKIIDPVSVRLFFVRDPVEVHIEGAREMEVTLKNHPTDASLGSRKVRVSDRVLVAGEDAANVKPGDEVRLIELYNIKVRDVEREDGKVKSIRAEMGGDEIRQSMPKIQWIAKNDILDFKVMIPKELYVGDEYNTKSLEMASGCAESFVSTLKPDTKVQFVRFGFCRIDGNNTAILTHR
ncbi:glutamate--tRNA ligase [Candidatus Nitrososphaera sp. FF02]|uniref:glutamate--tRNA ligase n=1 Tax=Candidatus Nitrososphaera sp. FF02 TaxID=3398226 RepID=UPI0039E9696D